MLSVGCTSGQLIVLHWDSISIIHTPPTVLKIWDIHDDMSIDHMTWTSLVLLSCDISIYIY